ncbi:MAG: hypothetical protein RIR66_1011 [Actinomycetota bacterium]
MSLGPFVSLWVFDQDNLDSWLSGAKTAINTLQAKAGFIDAQVGRSPDQANRLIVTTKWADVGSYRRAVSSTEAKMNVWPFLANMKDEPSAFEVLQAADGANFSHYDSSLDS